jgi:hypothetical protein
MEPSYRIERDSLGEVRVPAEALYGTQTQRAGQYVRFLYTLGEPGVYAWDLPEPPLPATLHLSRYVDLLLRAAATVFQPLGMAECLVYLR